MPATFTPTIDLPRVTPAPGAQVRRVLGVVDAPQAYEGEGFPVRRAFAGIDRRHLDPFVHMDQMGEVHYAPGEPKGTPWHPHRGFETFTYLIDGQFMHQDSHGGGGVINDGGTQYMTAGDGVLHIETPPEKLVMSGGVFHGVQLWINLPKSKKRMAPQYQDLQVHDTVLVSTTDGGALIRVLAGELQGHKGPGISHTPLVITHVSVTPGAVAEIPWRKDFNALAYVLAGDGFVGNELRPVHTGQMSVLVDGEVVRIGAAPVQNGPNENLEIFLIGGVPLREPVVQYGPFVMTTPEEIREAFEDFQKGRFGQVPANAIQPFRG